MPLSAGHDVIEKDLHADPDQGGASRHLHPLPKEEQIVETSGAIWVETFKATIFNLRMEVTGTTGLARDITERKRFFGVETRACRSGPRRRRLRQKALYYRKT